ncbi:hypothetical protein ANCCEY_08101 [Ancylostoma ceylanicum]|uniref:Uncharacterized protein n=1 Tax=Ancylostoma ceylanicum TaxID=53326 RepID=A0A0D6LS10_9BILA|nr:hypothetical protein ANCCEY_08101 [Ancylostoma ceylanicum]
MLPECHLVWQDQVLLPTKVTGRLRGAVTAVFLFGIVNGLHHLKFHLRQDLQKVVIATDEDQIRQRAGLQQEMVDLHLGVFGLLPGEGDPLPGKFMNDIVEKAYLQCERENDVTVPARTVIESFSIYVTQEASSQTEPSVAFPITKSNEEFLHEQEPYTSVSEMSEVVCHHHAGVKDVTVLNMHGLRDVVDHGLPFTQGEGRGLVPGLDHEVLKRREILS